MLLTLCLSGYVTLSGVVIGQTVPWSYFYGCEKKAETLDIFLKVHLEIEKE